MNFKFKEYAIINSALIEYEKKLKAAKAHSTILVGLEIDEVNARIKTIKEMRDRLANATVKEEEVVNNG